MEMFINEKNIILKPINKDNLSLLKLWYAKVDSFGFATGGRSLEETLPADENSFLVGIFINQGKKCIGVISGDFKQTKEPVLWIKTFLVDTVWQRKKYGTCSFNALCDYASQQFGIKRVYVSVLKKNTVGIVFWTRMGMSCVKAIQSEESMHGILIFEKVI